MTWGQNFYTRCAKDERIAMPNLAALRAAIFLLFAKNRWGTYVPPALRGLNICHFLIICPTSFSHSMFGDDILPFDVVEVPVPRRNGFHARAKNQNRSILALSQIVRHRRRRLCREFELLSRDAPSSKLMIFMQHLDSTGYRVNCTTHTRADQRSPCPTLTWMPCASQSPQVPKNNATVHRSWDSLTLFSLSLSVYPSWILCKGKASTL